MTTTSPKIKLSRPLPTIFLGVSQHIRFRLEVFSISNHLDTRIYLSLKIFLSNAIFFKFYFYHLNPNSNHFKSIVLQTVLITYGFI